MNKEMKKEMYKEEQGDEHGDGPGDGPGNRVLVLLGVGAEEQWIIWGLPVPLIY